MVRLSASAVQAAANRGSASRAASIVYRHEQGDTPAEIHEGFPSVPLADIYAAISYYLRHLDEVQASLAEREAEAARIRQDVESRPENKALREKLLAHREQRT